ncbi:maleylacetoacetate isomerase [Phytophthora nicotianae CJ01A1]|uniref:maleylacetoacetate isomerase n=3 Tax=Phytophthora nicotianae TaxID=4792 RepID=W2H590_PHYNI|nr:maleylacetoacetate isomerase [Phytophthora nicotianae]ETL43195.1 maleylacetoacetate isomerase [Phytophthora nicotianae]ETO78619.1 maleylacetoacetate isomerase [Phytophthora nicotianae P1976]ETP19660.1 maleylacetoacetate isomerase [Phytophthora nicotianae CJ01A1]
MAENYILYSYWRSSCSWRVRISLEWKGIPYEYRSVHLLNRGGEHFKDEYTTLNPNQRLPTLVVDGKVLPQSVAILEFLEETHPEKPLLPSDPFARAQVRNLCAIIGCDIQPIQNLTVQVKATEEVPEDQRVAKKQAWGRFWIERGFEALERELAKTAATYCFGDEITLADLYLQPQVYNANRVGVDMTKYPTISRISASLEMLPAFQKAHPSQQPDAVN